MASSEGSSESSSVANEGEMEIEMEVEEVTGRGKGRGRTGSRGRRPGSSRKESESRGRGGNKGKVASTGKGAGRGKGRGKGASKGKAVKTPLETVVPSDKERVRRIRQKKKEETKELIKRMSCEKLRDLVLELVDREPALVFDLCEAEEGGSQPPTPPPPGTATSPDWCKCGNCRQMPTDLEKKCCACLPRNCISVRDEIDRLVLDPQVLAIGQRYMRDMLGRHNQQLDNYNRGMRHSAYRNFTLWRHGRLGAGQRRVIPSCCVWRIRDEFPSPGGQYTGFIPGRYV